MTADPKKTKPLGTGFLLLALGLLIGFVIGFVLLLSRLPVDPAVGGFRAGEIDVARDAASDYEFYTVLADERVARPAAAGELETVPLETVRADMVVIPPATRTVPGNAQRLDRRNLAAESYREIPASNLGKESYYLQAGNYRGAEEAEKARAAVLLLGLDAFIVTRRDARGATGHRVRIGPFVDPSRLTEAKRRLRGGGVSYEIVRVTG